MASRTRLWPRHIHTPRVLRYLSSRLIELIRNPCPTGGFFRDSRCAWIQSPFDLPHQCQLFGPARLLQIGEFSRPMPCSADTEPPPRPIRRKRRRQSTCDRPGWIHPANHNVNIAVADVAKHDETRLAACCASAARRALSNESMFDSCKLTSTMRWVHYVALGTHRRASPHGVTIGLRLCDDSVADRVVFQQSRQRGLKPARIPCASPLAPQRAHKNGGHAAGWDDQRRAPL